MDTIPTAWVAALVWGLLLFYTALAVSLFLHRSGRKRLTVLDIASTKHASTEAWREAQQYGEVTQKPSTNRRATRE